MKIFYFILLVFLSLNSCGQSGVLGVAAPHNPPTSFAEFEVMASTLNDRRYDGNPIITYVPATWKARQVHFPFIIENPFHTDSLIMFYGGGSILSGGFAVGRADASKANPYAWVEYAGNPIFSPASIGLGTTNIVGVDDAWWNPVEERFELACATYAGDGSHLHRYISDDGFNFTSDGSMIEPSGDETYVGNSGILRDGATWYCAYTFRTTTETLPGVRIASSIDEGATWTKHGDFLTLGPDAYDDQYMEGVQFIKVGSDYILNYGSAGNIDGGIVYSGALAHSTTPLGTYTKSSINPFFEHSDLGWDSTQVSCIVVFSVVEPWLVFYVGTASVGDYNMALWSMGIATFY